MHVEVKGWQELQKCFFSELFPLVIITIIRPENIYPIDWDSTGVIVFPIDWDCTGVMVFPSSYLTWS